MPTENSRLMSTPKSCPGKLALKSADYWSSRAESRDQMFRVDFRTSANCVTACSACRAPGRRALGALYTTEVTPFYLALSECQMTPNTPSVRTWCVVILRRYRNTRVERRSVLVLAEWEGWQ